MLRTEFGTGADEFAQAVKNGPPYVVRYQWAGGDDRREREVVTEALAACFGAKTLEREQTIGESAGDLGPLADRVKYAFWLLRIFGLSLGFTHARESPGGAPVSGTVDARAPGEICRISMRVDRSRYREEYGEY